MRQNSSLKDQLTAAKRLLLCCTTSRISREADCELLFLAVGQFRSLIAMVGASSCALVPQVSIGVAKQHVTSLFLLMAGAK